MATVHLEDYMSSAEPWHYAFATCGPGGTVLLDDGVFPCPVEQVPNGVTISGVGPSTCITRRTAFYGPAINANMRDDVTIRSLRVHGNYPAFVGYEGFINGEICINGRNNRVERVTVDGFARYGVEANGVSPTVVDNVITGVGDAVHSAYGILVPASAHTSGIRVSGNRVQGTYSAGIVAGGMGGVVVGNMVDNCHIGHLPAGTGGGQIAIATTCDGSGATTQSNGFIITDNRVGPSVGRQASGIELDSCYDITLGNNIIMGQYGYGLSVHLASSVTVSGGIISACDTSGVRVGAGCFAITVSSVVLRANRVGVCFEGGTPSSNLLALIGNQFLYNQEHNYVNQSGAPNITLLGNQWDTHDPVE